MKAYHASRVWFEHPSQAFAEIGDGRSSHGYGFYVGLEKETTTDHLKTRSSAADRGIVYEMDFPDKKGWMDAYGKIDSAVLGNIITQADHLGLKDLKSALEGVRKTIDTGVPFVDQAFSSGMSVTRSPGELINSSVLGQIEHYVPDQKLQSQLLLSAGVRAVEKIDRAVVFDYDSIPRMKVSEIVGSRPGGMPEGIREGDYTRMLDETAADRIARNDWRSDPLKAASLDIAKLDDPELHRSFQKVATVLLSEEFIQTSPETPGNRKSAAGLEIRNQLGFAIGKTVSSIDSDPVARQSGAEFLDKVGGLVGSETSPDHPLRGVLREFRDRLDWYVSKHGVAVPVAAVVGRVATDDRSVTDGLPEANDRLAIKDFFAADGRVATVTTEDWRSETLRSAAADIGRSNNPDLQESFKEVSGLLLSGEFVRSGPDDPATYRTGVGYDIRNHLGVAVGSRLSSIQGGRADYEDGLRSFDKVVKLVTEETSPDHPLRGAVDRLGKQLDDHVTLSRTMAVAFGETRDRQEAPSKSSALSVASMGETVAVAVEPVTISSGGGLSHPVGSLSPAVGPVETGAERIGRGDWRSETLRSAASDIGRSNNPDLQKAFNDVSGLLLSGEFVRSGPDDQGTYKTGLGYDLRNHLGVAVGARLSSIRGDRADYDGGAQSFDKVMNMVSEELPPDHPLRAAFGRLHKELDDHVTLGRTMAIAFGETPDRTEALPKSLGYGVGQSSESGAVTPDAIKSSAPLFASQASTRPAAVSEFTDRDQWRSDDLKSASVAVAATNNPELRRSFNDVSQILLSTPFVRPNQDGPGTHHSTVGFDLRNLLGAGITRGLQPSGSVQPVGSVDTERAARTNPLDRMERIVAAQTDAGHPLRGAVATFRQSFDQHIEKSRGAVSGSERAVGKGMEQGLSAGRTLEGPSRRRSDLIEAFLEIPVVKRAIEAGASLAERRLGSGVLDRLNQKVRGLGDDLKNYVSADPVKAMEVFEAVRKRPADRTSSDASLLDKAAHAMGERPNLDVSAQINVQKIPMSAAVLTAATARRQQSV